MIFPAAATDLAARVDGTAWLVLAVCLAFALPVLACLVGFSLRYRRGRAADRARPPVDSVRLEALWIGLPGLIGLALFAWGAALYFRIERAPARGLDLDVVGMQWMWKVQHPEGIVELDELHVPAGAPVRLTLTSQDVIHSFYVPAFRLKQDVVPGRYTTAWFQATRPGTYALRCAEYCGTAHAGMGGRVVVLAARDYAAWIGAHAVGGPAGARAATGARLFRDDGCAACHRADARGAGPALAGLYGRRVRLAGGGARVADDTYLRESILLPARDVVRGWAPVMPTYQGQIGELEVRQLVAYIRSLPGDPARPAVAAAGVRP